MTIFQQTAKIQEIACKLIVIEVFLKTTKETLTLKTNF